MLCLPTSVALPSLYALPSLEQPHSLPLVQVERQLHPDTKLEWRKNPNTVIVCSQPESPVVQGQLFWWCHQPEAEPRIVVRQSSMLIYSKETQLPAIAMPEVSAPFLLTVHLMLETIEGLATKAHLLAASLEEPISLLQDWPCVDKVEVKMTAVPPRTEKWGNLDSVSQDTGETTPAQLPTLTETMAQEIINEIDLPKSDGENLVIYIPTIAMNEVYTFQMDNSQLFMVGGLDTPSVHHWLAKKVGIPDLDGDGSFPSWYEEWYWYSVARKLSTTIALTFSRVHHLVEKPLQLEASHSMKEQYDALAELHQQLEILLTQKNIQSGFPIEHYAAIFAPLLFPLLLPLFVGTIKELKRYKEKKRRKNSTAEKRDKVD